MRIRMFMMSLFT